MDTLREKIAEVITAFALEVGKSPGHDLGPKAFTIADGVIFCIGLKLDPSDLADAILALPEMEALRLKVIKTMAVRK